ncbi:unnamed protein product [Onchocerca flexuosa]|uniref:Ovule protein n=1 Tax=Onchocerca flexuosa TaxID=387005 RepID=A0A183HZP0_9BILA|nr:unnamed protein product [Onchocerca flexuosa]
MAGIRTDLEHSKHAISVSSFSRVENLIILESHDRDLVTALFSIADSFSILTTIMGCKRELTKYYRMVRKTSTSKRETKRSLPKQFQFRLSGRGHS